MRIGVEDALGLGRNEIVINGRTWEGDTVQAVPAVLHISAQNIDRRYSLEPPRRGGSNEHPQSMFLSRKKKNNVYPCKLQFYYIKVGV